MFFNLENFLQKIDLSFKNKSNKDINMIYIMIFSAIFAFSYLLFWDSSLANVKEINKKILSLKNRLRIDNLYLSANPKIKITKLNSEIKKLKTNLTISKDKNSYIKNKIEAISSLLYNEKTWGAYISSISKNAKKYDIKILSFTNKKASGNGSFGHMLDIDLHITANYLNTVKFINSLEQSELVVDLHAFKIQAQDKLNADLNISVWGINY